MSQLLLVSGYDSAISAQLLQLRKLEHAQDVILETVDRPTEEDPAREDPAQEDSAGRSKLESMDELAHMTEEELMAQIDAMNDIMEPEVRNLMMRMMPMMGYGMRMSPWRMRRMMFRRMEEINDLLHMMELVDHMTGQVEEVCGFNGLWVADQTLAKLTGNPPSNDLGEDQKSMQAVHNGESCPVVSAMRCEELTKDEMLLLVCQFKAAEKCRSIGCE